VTVCKLEVPLFCTKDDVSGVFAYKNNTIRYDKTIWW